MEDTQQDKTPTLNTQSLEETGAKTPMLLAARLTPALPPSHDKT